MANIRKPCVIGNWKMQGSLEMITDFVSALSAGIGHFEDHPEIERVLCPPALYFQAVEDALQKNVLKSQISLGAQNVYCESSGAFTGEISPEMLKDMDCRYVIIGHSERRQLFFEDDTLIARKCVAAYHAGLIPILCIGETGAERADGKTEAVVCRQLQAVLAQLPISDWGSLIIAYEPVWAIGTGLTATPDQAEAVHGFLRNWLGERDNVIAQKIRILYGGSVKAANADGLFSMPNIDGALVGGASLIAAEFLQICNSATKGKK